MNRLPYGLLLFPVCAFGGITVSPAIPNFSDLHGIPTVAADGEVKRVTTAGQVISYAASANTDTARGIALSSAVTAHIAGDKLMIGQGTYLVASPLNLLSNTTIEGNGNVTIKLSDQASSVTATVIQSSAAGQTGNAVRNLTIDCNLAGQTGTNVTIQAVSLGGRSCLIDGVHAINWGCKGSGAECFVLGIYHYPGTAITTAENNKITRCLVDTPASVTHGANGTTAIDIYGENQTGGGITTVGDGWMIAPEITGCTVQNITTGSTSGKPYLFHAFTFGSSYGASLHDNYVYNLQSAGADPYKDCTAFYIDTWSVRSLGIYNNHFLNVAKGIFLNSSNTYTYDNWNVTGNHLDLNSTSDGNYGIASAGSIGTNWSIINNLVDSATAGVFVGLTAHYQRNNHKSGGAAVGNPTTLASSDVITKTGNYTATTSDYVILVDSTSATVTITLPTAVGSTQPYIVKDWKGQAATHNITVNTTSAQTIDGAATKVISSNYGSYNFVSDGAAWSVY